MTGIIRGERPRPRVALLGNFPVDDVEAIERMFPTLYKASKLPQLENLVDVRELDVLIVGDEISEVRNWPWDCHVICFSSDVESLPGPIENSYLERSGDTETEAFTFPDLALPLARRRNADLANVGGVRGWPKIELTFYSSTYQSASQEQRKAAKEIVERGVVIAEEITGEVLSACYIRPDGGLGVAWLPNPSFVRHKWVALLLQEWAGSDPDALSEFRTWEESEEWMTPSQRQIIGRIEATNQQKQAAVDEFNSRLDDLEVSLAEANRKANENERRLITAQGQDLVDEVALSFEKMGFGVDDVDAGLDPNAPKREDLRLTDPADIDWVALVEVRGYSRSSGRTRDLIRIARFVELYNQETGRFPDKRIYVVNGETELPPDQRSYPLMSALEDVEIFADSGGLIIWSLDLFRSIHSDEVKEPTWLKESVKDASGIWRQTTDGD